MLIPLKLVRDQQLQQQLFDQLRELIVSDRLRPGSRMPSSRMMAEQFSISRMTVLLTYERLIAEGYLETRPAAGTFVARPAEKPVAVATDASALSLAHATANAKPNGAMGRTGEEPPAGWPGSATHDAEPRTSGADASLFPVGRWRSLMRQSVDRMGARVGAEPASGHPAPRDAIAAWLSTSRGLAVSPDQVMLVNSRQQALHVIARLASHPCEGRRAIGRASGCPVPHNGATADEPVHIVVEDPCDPAAAAVLGGEGARLTRVPVDADGPRADQLPEYGAAVIHVTPEHQRPLGVTMSRPRRAAVLDWAGRNGALVLEEDIEGELRYDNQNLPSLMSLDRSERVIMLGGFGVSLGPWLDTAYLVLPHWLVPFAHAIRRQIDDSRGGLEQMALAEFIGGGGYARHLHRLSKAYASRRDALLDALRRHFGEPVRIWGGHSGLHLSWCPPPGIGSPGGLAALARRHGLDATAPRDDVVVLGFGALDERHLELAVGRLAEALTAGPDRLAPGAAPAATRRVVAQGALS